MNTISAQQFGSRSGDLIWVQTISKVSADDTSRQKLNETFTFNTVDVEGGVNGCLLMLNLMGPGVPGAR